MLVILCVLTDNGHDISVWEFFILEAEFGRLISPNAEWTLMLHDSPNPSYVPCSFNLTFAVTLLTTGININITL